MRIFALILLASSPLLSNFSVSVDPLYWQSHLGGAGVAIQTEPLGDFFSATGKNRVRNLDFDWDVGVRLSVGYTNPCDEWQSQLIWTTFKNSAHRTFSDGSFVPIWSHPQNAPSSVESGRAKWELLYSTLDWENAKSFCIGKCVFLQPHAGLRAAWIDQRDNNIRYNGLATVLQKDRSFGIGLRGGLDLYWIFCHHFCLFSNAAASLLTSYHSVKHQELSDNPFFVNNFFHIASAIFDTQIGIGFERGCFRAELGFEQHWLPSQNQFMLFVDDQMRGKFVQNQGDLGMMGLFLSVRFDF